jgi:hypothetical protein
MENTFNIKRFGKLFLLDFRMFRKIYASIVILVFCTTIIHILEKHHFSYIRRDLILAVASSIFEILPVILLFTIPFILYGFVRHSTKGVMYALLPATSFEKIVSAWIHCVVVAPFFVLGATFLGTFSLTLTPIFTYEAGLGYISATAPMPEGWMGIAHALEARSYFEDYRVVVLLQAPVFLCAFWLKRNVSTLGIAALCIILFIYILHQISGFAVEYFGPEVWINLIWFWPILFWVLTYFIFRRTQI